MTREQRIAQYLAEALELIEAGHRDHLPILGRLDNAAIAASLCGLAEVREAIGEVEECFILGRYKAAARTLSAAIASLQRELRRTA